MIRERGADDKTFWLKATLERFEKYLSVGG